MCPSPMNTSSTVIQKTVKFDQVFIHEFPLIMGDNPAVSKGAPLTIDWKPIAHDVIDLDIYEYLREPERRHRKRIIMSTSKRAKILMNAGYSIDAIAEMTLQVEDAKRIRAEHALEGEGTSWKINLNIMDLLSGAAEGTGRTLFFPALTAATATGQAVGKVGLEVVKGTGKVVVGTGKVATDVVVGTGRLGYDVVVGTGKVGMDVTVLSVKGTGKLVVGAGKATTGFVVGTGKLVKNTGRRMSRFMNLNDSTAKDLALAFQEEDDPEEDEEVDLGYGDPFLPAAEEPTKLVNHRSASDTTHNNRRDRRGSVNTDRRGSNGAPQRVPRRGSQERGSQSPIGGTPVTSPTAAPKTTKSPKRRGSGNNALAGSLSNIGKILTGRGLRRSNSSSGGCLTTDPKYSRRSKSNDGASKKTPRRRRTMTTSPGPTSPRSKSATPTTITELAQMEQFLTYVRTSDRNIIGNAFANSTSSLGYDDDDEAVHGVPPPSPPPPRRRKSADTGGCALDVESPIAATPVVG